MQKGNYLVDNDGKTSDQMESNGIEWNRLILWRFYIFKKKNIILILFSYSQLFQNKYVRFLSDIFILKFNLGPNVFIYVFFFLNYESLEEGQIRFSPLVILLINQYQEHQTKIIFINYLIIIVNS